LDQGDIKHIALLESLLRRNAFDELVSQFSRLEVLFAIVDAQLGDENEDNKNKRRWELETFQGKAMIYKPDQGKFEFDTGEYVCDKSIYRRVERASQWLSSCIHTDQLYPGGISIWLAIVAKK
jgi:hypothetical protein